MAGLCTPSPLMCRHNSGLGADFPLSPLPLSLPPLSECPPPSGMAEGDSVTRGGHLMALDGVIV
jgi:hypothetical protein